MDRIREVIAQCIPEKDVVQGMRGAHQWSDARLRRALGSDDEQPSTSASDPSEYRLRQRLCST